MPLIRTSALDDRSIMRIRTRLGDHPMHRFYFETALTALDSGIDNRLHHLSAAGGVVQVIEFDDKVAASSHGALDAGDLDLLAALPGDAELHVGEIDAPALRARLGGRVSLVRELKYYDRNQRVAPAADPRCRRLGPSDFDRVDRFIRRAYHGTVISAWMADTPFVALFEDGEIACVAGTVVANPGLGTAIVGNLITDPAARGRGLASATVRSLVAVMAADGFGRLLLATTEDNVPAWRIAESLDFKLVERRVQIDVDGV